MTGDPLRPGSGTSEYRAALGVLIALVAFLFSGFFSGMLSEDAALGLITTICVYSGSLFGMRTGLKGAAIVREAGKVTTNP